MRTVIKARDLGAVDYVSKPVEREMLHQALSRALAVIERRSQKLDDREHAVADARETCVNPQERQLGRQLRTAFERNRENIFLGCAKTQHSLYS